MTRMESRGDAAAARIVEVGDGGILGTALARDRARENPRMAIGDEPLLARLQREDAAVHGVEEVHGGESYDVCWRGERCVLHLVLHRCGSHIDDHRGVDEVIGSDGAAVTACELVRMGNDAPHLVERRLAWT